jgi:hypothetical protein
VVEGTSDEHFSQRILPEGIDIFIAGTRDTVLVTAHEVRAHGLTQVACLVDRDFDDVVGKAIAAGLPVVAYDGADLECMLFMSPALHTLLREFASDVKLKSFGGPEAVRRTILELVLPVARLRRANATHRWGVNFDGVDFGDRIKVSNLRLDLGPLADALLAASLGPSTTRKDLIEAARTSDAPECPQSGCPMVRGKDALAALGVALRRKLGNLQKPEAHHDRLAKVLRVAADRPDLQQTIWYQRVVEALAIGRSPA